MEQILMTYYENNAKKLRETVDKILLKFGGIPDGDVDDFYSLANEVFVDTMRRYDGVQPFDAFLYSCLRNKIKTEITRRNRIKRRTDRMSIPLDTPVGEDEDVTIGDMLADSFTIEGELFDGRNEGYSQRMLLYLNRLSRLQREVLNLDMAGYLPAEIREILHINEKQYADCYDAIRSYRNISVLF